MRMMGEQFVTGQTIGAALANSRKLEEKGFRYSYRHAGRSGHHRGSALRYLQSYEQAIHAIGQASQGRRRPTKARAFPSSCRPCTRATAGPSANA